jgi:hypothetical protein
MEPADCESLRLARAKLEHPSFAARLSNVVGTPIDVALHLLPSGWYRRLHGASEAVIRKSLDVGVTSLRHEQEVVAHESVYRLLVAGTGALGGVFGLAGLAVELPLTTTLMLRAIADIARSEGESVHDPETVSACLEVFALGGRTELDDATETGYYGVRLALAAYLGANVTQTGKATSASAHFVRAVASRFGVSVSERGAARLLPVVGALGAATINVLFIKHFQDMARGHFVVRRLERKYGKDFVRRAYERLGR